MRRGNRQVGIFRSYSIFTNTPTPKGTNGLEISSTGLQTVDLRCICMTRSVSGPGSRRGGTSMIVSRTGPGRSEEHTSELQSRGHLVCRLLLEKKKAHTSQHVMRFASAA